MLKQNLDDEFFEIQIRDMESKSDNTAYSLLTVAGISFTVLIALQDLIFLLIGFASLIIGIVMQLNTKAKIKKLKQERQENKGFYKYKK